MGQAACKTLQAVGFEAVFRLSATEGFITCQERGPDLVITEYRLAEESGLDFFRKLRRLADPPPALMISALGTEEVAAEAMGLGALTYKVKTASYLDELPALAKQCLSEWDSARQEKERFWKKKKQESQNELAAWMSHNFRNILAASIGYLNLIDFSNPQQNNDRRAYYLKDSIQTQQSAIELLEKIGRLTENPDFSDVERVDVGEVVDEAWENARKKVLANIAASWPERLELAQAQLSHLIFFNSARRLEPVEMLRSDLLAAMEALLCNALEAVMSSETPRILVSGGMGGHKLELTVRDNGRGMDEAVLQHATEALFSTKGEVGVGLGLSLVNSIAARYDGELAFKSIPGAGTSAKLSLTMGK